MPRRSHPALSVTDSSFELPLSLPDALFRHLGQAIAEGRLKPNERLVETKLCAEFGCSRSPLREALRMLAAEGLVVLSPRKGARVVELSIKTLTNVFDVRVLLEGLAARRAAQNRSMVDVARLRSLNTQMRDAVERSDHDAFFELNNALHREIGRIADNEYLAGLQETVAARSFLPLFLFLSDLDHVLRAVEAHDGVIDAIERGDPDGAETTMRAHVVQLQREAERLIEERNETGSGRDA
jgi:DNA-binding GntR family transcriptional regulator